MHSRQVARWIGNALGLAVVLGTAVLLLLLWRAQREALPTLAQVRAWIENGHWEEASAAIDRYLANGDRRSPVLFLAGRVRAAAGRYEEALRFLEQIPQGVPDYLEAVFRRAQILRVIGRRRDSERLFKELMDLGRQRNTPAALEFRRAAIYELVSMYSLERRAREAIPLIWEVYPEHAEPWRLLIALARLQGEPVHIDEAVTELLAAVQADEQDGISRRALAWYYLKGGRFKEAAQMAHQAVELLPEDWEARAVLFEVYVAQQNFAAIDQWLRSHPLPSQAPVAFWKVVAQACEGLGRLQRAEHFYRKALELAPYDHRIHFALGGLLIRLGNKEEGQRHLARFRALKEHYQAIQQFISELGGDARAAEWSVPTPEKCLELARHCAGLGRRREAIGWSEMALAQNPSFAPAADYLEQLRTSSGS